MLYVIKGKYYILVSGYYKEVKIEKNGNSYDVIPVENANKTKIEASTVKEFSTISVDKAVNDKGKRSLDMQ